MDQRLSVKERPNKIANRLGYWTSRRHEDYQAKDGLSRDCDWSMKLKRPRMAMVADLEEERMGKKRQIVPKDIEEEEEEDFNMNFVIKQDVQREESVPLDDELVFKVKNENFMEIPEEITSDGSEDLSDLDSFNPHQFQQEKRKFHFTNLKVYTSASLTEEDVDTVDVDDRMDEYDKDVGEGLALAKQPEPEDLTNSKGEEQNSFSESVLEKIEALKRIDEKLLDIEKEKGKRLKTALSSSSGSKKYGMYQNPKKRLGHRSPSRDQGIRRTGKSRGRDASSSSSSISSSDSSSSSNDESTSENEESVKRNVSGQETDDLRNKLKQYLTKLKRKGVKKT